MSSFQIEEDAPNQKLSLRSGEQHITLDSGTQTLSLRSSSLFGLRQKRLEIPFSRLEELSLQSHSRGERDAPLNLKLVYQGDQGRREESLSFTVKDVNHRAEVMDLLFRMARATTSSYDGAFRDGEAMLALDRYLVRRCTEDTISLSVVRSTSPESIQGRPIPVIELPADYASDEALRRVEPPIPDSFDPKRFLGVMRFLQWEPGRRVELLSAIPPTELEQRRYQLAKRALLLVFLPAILDDWLGVKPNDGVVLLWGLALIVSIFYSIFTKLYRYVSWSPEKLFSKLVHRFAWGWAAVYILSVVGIADLTAPWSELCVVISGLSFVFAGVGIAARRGLDPEHVVQEGGHHAILDWREQELRSLGDSKPLSLVRELVCSLHQEEVDGKTLFFSRLDAVLEGCRATLAETDKVEGSRLEPYFALSPMGVELSNALHVPLRSEDHTTEATPQTAWSEEEVVVPEEVEVSR